MKKPITDHLGNHYESIKKMCDAYSINEKTYHSRVNRDKYTLEEALGVMPRISQKTKDLIVDDKLTILHSIPSDDKPHILYFHCLYNGFEDIMTYDNVFEYYRKNIF